MPWLFGMSFFLIFIGLIIVLFAIMKLVFKVSLRGIRKLLSNIAFDFFVLFDRIFVVNKGKTIEYKGKAEKEREQQENEINSRKNISNAKQWLGAVSFVENLKRKYPNAEERIFLNMTDELMKSKNINDFERLENVARDSHYRR
ncbi:hypothetical protein D3C87_78770 [compost metagenome]